MNLPLFTDWHFALVTDQRLATHSHPIGLGAFILIIVGLCLVAGYFGRHQ